MSVDLVRSLSERLQSEQRIIANLDAYFTGTQPLQFLHPQVRAATAGRLTSLVINWPRVIVGAVEERLDVEGFRLAGQEAAIPDLWRIWQANDLDEWSQLGHVDAMVHGRCFALVWSDPQDLTTPRITVETAREMTVSYYPGTALVSAALKVWPGDGIQYATLYLPDRVERYDAPSPYGGVSGLSAGWVLREVIPHDLGLVPVVPFVNRPRLGSRTGESELSDVIPITDAISKLSTDLMVSAEYHAMPRRWATGVELGANAERTREEVRQKWTEAEAGRVWMTDSADASFGQFPEANLTNFVSAIGMLTGQVAAVAGIPPHYLGVNSDNPASADAIRSAESSLVKKAKRKQRGFGGSWERVMRIAQLVRDGQPDPELQVLETIWRDPETPTVAQKADAAVKLVQANIISAEQALEDLGYSPVQIARELQRRADAALGPVRAQLDEAARLEQDQGLPKDAAFAAVGLMQAAASIRGATTA